MPLTKRQREILDFIQDFIAEYGYSPSFEEIALRFGFSSLATVHEHISNLEAKGYVRKDYNRSRSLEVMPTEQAEPAAELPLLGAVAAGAPIEAITDPDTIAVPPDMVRSGRNYVLRVRGDSMVDEQIRDGDYIVVNARDTADDGEMVIALVSNESATVKTLYREGRGRIRLQPANPTMQPLIYDEAEVTIQGIVVGVIRKF